MFARVRAPARAAPRTALNARSIRSIPSACATVRWIATSLDPSISAHAAIGVGSPRAALTVAVAAATAVESMPPERKTAARPSSAPATAASSTSPNSPASSTGREPACGGAHSRARRSPPGSSVSAWPAGTRRRAATSVSAGGPGRRSKNSATATALATRDTPGSRRSARASVEASSVLPTRA